MDGEIDAETSGYRDGVYLWRMNSKLSPQDATGLGSGDRTKTRVIYWRVRPYKRGLKITATSCYALMLIVWWEMMQRGGVVAYLCMGCWQYCEERCRVLPRQVHQARHHGLIHPQHCMYSTEAWRTQPRKPSDYLRILSGARYEIHDSILYLLHGAHAHTTCKAGKVTRYLGMWSHISHKVHCIKRQ